MRVIETYDLTKYDERGSVMLKIAIDAGHGLYTNGKRCMAKLDGAQTREWTLNNRVANRFSDLLRSYNCEVLRVDDPTGKTDVSRPNRAKKANDLGADVYISIHHNAGIYGGSGGGTVVFYYSSKLEREAQAKALYDEIIAETGLIGNRSTKVKKKGYDVLKQTNMPAFLLENGFMDSKTDVPIILSETHAKKTAKGLVDFLVSQFDLTLKEGATVEEPADDVFKVRVTVPELNYRSGPGVKYKVNGVIRSGGVYTIIETEGNWGKLKSGAGWINISDKYCTRL